MRRQKYQLADMAVNPIKEETYIVFFCLKVRCLQLQQDFFKMFGQYLVISDIW